MKRMIILLLFLAIVISLAATSFSVYNKTVTVSTSVLTPKVFNISNGTRYPVVDTRPLETTPFWLFMVFRTDNPSKNQYDLHVLITLNSYYATDDLLKVELYDQKLPAVILATATFPRDSNFVELTVVSNKFLDPVKKQILTLKYTYNSDPVDDNNNPFADETVTSSVDVWGVKQPGNNH